MRSTSEDDLENRGKNNLQQRGSICQSIIFERSKTSAFFILQVLLPGIMMLPSAKWNQGIRHGPATYFHPNGNKEEETYVEGYEEVTEEEIDKEIICFCTGRVNCVLCKWEGGEEKI